MRKYEHNGNIVYEFVDRNDFKKWLINTFKISDNIATMVSNYTVDYLASYSIGSYPLKIYENLINGLRAALEHIKNRPCAPNDDDMRTYFGAAFKALQSGITKVYTKKDDNVQ